MLQSATQKQIKKHYRKMSLKLSVVAVAGSLTRSLTRALAISPSHPDKMVLGLNQTKEEADNVFVELTKAYKACVAWSDRVAIESHYVLAHA